MHCISITHKTAPIHIRERFSFTTNEQVEFGTYIMQHHDISGCVVVSTCNRSEIYFSGDNNAVLLMERVLSEYKQINQSDIRKHVHNYSNEKAVRHLFQVASGLDSMVLGEDEILRQIKDSYQLALDHKHTNNELNILFQGAMSASKLVKTDTNISTIPVSIGTLTANYIVEFLNQYEKRNVLIVGATGKIGSIVVKNLVTKQEISIIGTSRNHCSNQELFSNHPSVKIVDYHDRYEYLEQADVIVSATTSPHYTFTGNEVKNILEHNQQAKLFIDLAVPCDIDKEIGLLNHIILQDIDFFQKASKENNQIKLKELDKVQLILDHKIDETIKTVYFQEFYGVMEHVTAKINEDGVPSMLYHLKDTLNSQQLKSVLDALQDMIKGGR